MEVDIVVLIVVLLVAAIGLYYYYVYSPTQSQKTMLSASVTPSGSATGVGNGTTTTTTDTSTPAAKTATAPPGGTPSTATPITNPDVPAVSQYASNKYLQAGGQYLILENGQPITTTSDVSQATPVKIVPIPITSPNYGYTTGGSYIMTASGQYLNFTQLSPSANLTIPGQGMVTYTSSFVCGRTTTASMYIATSHPSNISFSYRVNYFFLSYNPQLSGYYVNSSITGDAVMITVVPG